MTTANGQYTSAAMQNHPSVDADMDMYFDFNQGQTPSSSKSPISSTSSMHRFSNMDQGSQKQVFGGPSHEYSRFKQQTGLPTGAVSNVIAYNDMGNDFETSPSFDYGMGGVGSSQMAGYNSGISMDMDFGSPSNLPSYMFMDGGGSSAFDEFVDPTAITESAPPPPTANRPYPGMHSQLAQQAKAQAMAKQQQQQLQGQAIMQQRMQQRPSVSSNRSSVSLEGGARKASATSNDHHVEESISRVLDQMRHNSRVSPIDEEDEDFGEDGPSRSGRSKREQEEMDEDERLLASEAGKKLTSKERRQLRNKVSARAFRSRRKEYISQLEGEVAAKTNEANELRAQNRNLMDQNSQLTRLTQTLLRHPAFGTFLEDMSNDPSILATLQTSAAQNIQQSQQQPQADEAEEEEDEEDEQPDTQVGMAMMPQTSLDFSMLNLGNAHWGGANNQFFQQPQVFSVTQLPEGPTLDQIMPLNLSGKPTESFEAPAKRDYPVIESSASSDNSKILPTITAPNEVDEDCESLYSNSTNSSPSSTCTLEEAARMLESSLSGKVPVHFNMRTVSTESPETSLQKIEHMFAALEPTYRRIEALTAHLPR